MSFTEAIKTCLSKYVTFEGRARRSEYWWFFLFVLLVVLVASLIDSALFGVDPETGQPGRLLVPLAQLALFLPMLAAGWRRMHDTDRRGILLLLPMLVSFVIMLIMTLGILGAGAMMRAGQTPEQMMQPTMLLGAGVLMVLWFVQIVLAILMLWWLTRPSDPGTNEYGPPPA